MLTMAGSGIDDVETDELVDACCGSLHDAEVTWRMGVGTYDCPTTGSTTIYA